MKDPLNEAIDRMRKYIKTEVGYAGPVKAYHTEQIDDLNILLSEVVDEIEEMSANTADGCKVWNRK